MRSKGGALFSVWLPELEAPTALPFIASGAQVLLVAESEQLSAREELLAELGCERLGFAFPADVAAFGNVVGDCEAVLIVAGCPLRVGALLRTIGPALGTRPLLLRVPDDGELRTDPACVRLAYPIIAEELSRLLAARRPDLADLSA
jgi:hypothetical protein